MLNQGLGDGQISDFMNERPCQVIFTAVDFYKGIYGMTYPWDEWTEVSGTNVALQSFREIL